jgi:aquaporin Z
VHRTLSEPKDVSPLNPYQWRLLFPGRRSGRAGRAIGNMRVWSPGGGPSGFRAETKGNEGKRMVLWKRSVAEFIGTFWLVFGGCGSAVLGAVFGAKLEGTPFNIGISHLGVSLAFGLTVLTMAYAIGHISGCHLNPAVSIGLAAAGRFQVKELVPYIIAQVLGGLAGAAVLWVIASGREGFSLADGFAANGYAEHSPGRYSLAACLAAEVVLTCMFLLIILGSTDRRAPAGFAPLAIGLGLTLIHLIGIPVTNLSVNPARSTGPAAFVGGWAMGQLWLFWVAPIAGAALAGIAYRACFEAASPSPEPALEPAAVTVAVAV